MTNQNQNYNTRPPLSWIGDIGCKLVTADIRSDLPRGQNLCQMAFESLERSDIFAVVDALLRSPLASEICFLLPQELDDGTSGLPKNVWFPGNTAAARNFPLPPGKRVKITAVGNDPADADTMRMVDKINKNTFLSVDALDYWFERFMKGDSSDPAYQLALLKDQKDILAAAIGGFLMTDPASLKLAVEYLREVRRLMVDGRGILQSFGAALPVLNLPKDESFFSTLKSPDMNRDWHEGFRQLYNERGSIADGFYGAELIKREDLELKLDDIRKKLASKPYVLSICEKVAANPADKDEMKQLLRFDWVDDCIGVFLTSKSQVSSKSSMAERTKGIIDRNFAVSSNEDRSKRETIIEYLDQLKKREKKKGAATEEDISFFNKYSSYISLDANLVKKWEKFIYPDDFVCSDFAEGLLKTVNALFSADLKLTSEGPAQRRISISFQAKQYRSYSEKVRGEMMRYFGLMYRDLRDLLGEAVEWHTDFYQTDGIDPLLDWDRWVDKYNIEENTNRNGDHAWALTFIIRDLNNTGNDRKKVLTWRFTRDSLACLTPRLLVGEDGNGNSAVSNPLGVMLLQSGNDSGRKGIIHDVTLTQSKTLRQTRRKIRIADVDRQLSAQFEIRKDEIPEKFKSAYETFKTRYKESVSNIPVKGFEYVSARRLYESYAELMAAASELPPGDKSRSEILSPLISVGTIRCEVDDEIFEVIPPWHPLRIYEIARHHHDVAFAVRKILSGSDDIRIGHEFLEQLQQEAERPSWPPMAVALDENLTNGGTPVFPIEHNHWFTLCARKDSSMTEVRTEATTAKAIAELTEAISSYDQVEADLTTEVKILEIEARDDEVNKQLRQSKAKPACLEDRGVELVLQTEDRRIATRIFNTIAGRPDNEAEFAETPLSPFGTRVTDASLHDLINSSSSPCNATVRPFHLALLDMIGSMHAVFKWIPVQWIGANRPESARPELSDCRKFVFNDETLSQMLLVSPVLTDCDKWFLRHVYYVCAKCEAADAYRKEETYLPVLEVRTDEGRNNKLGQMLLAAHNLADWVVTCDGMLTKKQIAHNQHLVIRCKRSAFSGTSVVISSASSADSLKTTLQARLDQLGKQNIRPDLDTVKRRLLQEALSISGYIGLRAAKHNDSAGELMGLCLSKHILSDMIARESSRLNESIKFCAFLMLDDYADWFNSKSSDKRIADIIAFCVTEDSSGKLRLHILISESKYRADMSEVKHSLDQAINTTDKLQRILSDDRNSGISGSLSLRIWLNRFANMIMDADISGITDSNLFYEYLNRIRNGDVSFTLNGYSHYFAFDQTGTSGIAEHYSGESVVWQQIFDQNQVIELLESLALKNSPYPIVSADDISADKAYRYSPLTRLLKIIDSSDIVCNRHHDDSDRDNVLDHADISPKDNKASAPLLSPADIRPETVRTSVDDGTTENKYGLRLSNLLRTEAKPFGYSKERLDWCDKAAQQLRIGLAENNISVTELRHVPTPNGCLVVYKGSSVLGQKTLLSLKEKLLMTRSLRIGFTEAAPGEFRVFIESDQREAVPMWNLWKDRKLQRHPDGSNTRLAIALKELDGQILYLDPMSDMGAPHTLVAGGTGSGKSVLIRMMILDIAATNSPSQARLYMIDPKKGINYASLKKLPHWASPFITESNEALSIMDELIAEMERRYELFAEASVEDLFQYNRFSRNNKLPVLWLFHDEIADWTRDKDYNREFTAKMTILATKARAAGIFLVLIAQRPDKDVLPMQVRDNLGNRLALKLETEASSKIALDKSGAELLLGKGHLAAKIGSSITYAQCAFLDNAQTALAAKAIIADYEADPDPGPVDSVNAETDNLDQ